MQAIQEICQVYEEGYSSIFITGRSLYDLVVASDGKIRPLYEVLRRELHLRYGMVMITYSMANGIDWDESRIKDERDRKTILSALKTHRLTDIPQDQNEIIRVIRGISSLSRTPTTGLNWADGKPMRFAFLFEFAEHIIPGTLTNGTQTDPQLVAIELAHITAQSLSLRASGNFVIFHGRDGLVDCLVEGALYRLRLPQPDESEKREFLNVARSLYPSAEFEEDLTDDAIVHLTNNTPNRGLESLMRASHRTNKPVNSHQLTAQKNHDVEEISEKTLTVLDTTRVNNINLVGINITKAQRIMEKFGNCLLNRISTMPSNILLVGPPGSGKTDLALLTARHGKVAAYQLNNPKGGIVGETERKSRIQMEVRREWVPNVGFIDEITEAFPLERSDFDGDSGASRAVMASLLTALSDETLRGKSLLIATTNCPWRMSAAMRSRFTIIPVLHPLKQDFPAIIVANAKRIDPHVELDPTNEAIKNAADIFYDKGANPRDIRGALSNAMLHHGNLAPETILSSAMDLTISIDINALIFSELWAIKSCKSKSFFPWSSNPKEYPFPDHLKNFVNPDNGEVNYSDLEKRIQELKPYANV